ncbi:hypothetical protein [Pseudomonas aeruginosa]|uniref:hypothetical protein n=1 Tax=Pseudomonas aeruginosa TaxID=287 RepID=UPI000F79AC0B|nr:hypothetical protein [Pseudomonas aeruginosa]RRX51828.1 hypothetical protein EGJ63_26680 [Pseudomonas aeruginosa]
MTDNPFAPPPAPVQPPARAVPATTQPYAFIAVLALVTCLSFAVSLGIQWYNDIGEIRQRFSEHLQLMAPHWFTGLVFYAAANLLVLHAYREKRQLVEFRPLALLLIGYGLLNLVCGMLAGIGLAPLTLPFYQWVTAQSSYGVWLMAFNEAMSWVYLLLGSLLPLGLVLLGSRVNSPRLAEGEEARVAAWQVALGAALCFATLCFKLMQFLPYALLRYDEPWLYGLYLSGVALPAALLFGAVCTRLPARLQRFAAGRALLLAVVAMLLWSVALLAVGGGLALLMILGLAPAGIGYTLLVALLGVGLLALLWPIGRLATRWCYADQLAA